MIAWDANGDRVEDAVAVMLLREHGDQEAQHRRGYGGDGGIDVYVPIETRDSPRVESGGPPIVDNYQIKRFTRTLGASQWTQIKKSLIAARDNTEFTIRTWYLVLPLNPTAVDERKLDAFARELAVPFRCAWRGLSYLNGLADKHRSVIDEFFHDGNQRMVRERAALYGLLCLKKQATEPLRTNDLLQPGSPLSALASRLNEIDTYYRYELRMSDRLPADLPAGLIMRRATGGDGWCIAIDAYPRFPEAPVWSPLETTDVSIMLRPDLMDETTREQLRQAIRGGATVTLLPGEVENIRLQNPDGRTEHLPTATMRLTPLGRPAPPRRRWRIAEPSGASIAEVTVVFRSPIHDQDDTTLTGRESNGVFTIEITNHDDHVDMTVCSTPQDVVGRPVRDVAAGIAFLAACHAPNTVISGFEDGETLTESPIPQTTPPVPADLTDHIADLAAIQPHTNTELRVPAEIDADTIETTRTIRWLIEGNGLQVDPEDARQLALGGQITADKVATLRRQTGPFPMTIPTPCPIPLDNCGQSVSLPQVTWDILASGLDGEPQPTRDGMVEVRFTLADSTTPTMYLRPEHADVT